jgi:hypothetical protein
VPVTVEAPGPALLGDLDAWLVVTIKKLVGDLTGGVFIGQFEGFGPEPLNVHHGDKTIGQDTFEGSIWPEVFEFAHRSINTPLLGTVY